MHLFVFDRVLADLVKINMTKRTNTSITPTAIELFAGVGGFRVGLNEVTFENGAVRERERE